MQIFNCSVYLLVNTNHTLYTSNEIDIFFSQRINKEVIRKYEIILNIYLYLYIYFFIRKEVKIVFLEYIVRISDLTKLLQKKKSENKIKIKKKENTLRERRNIEILIYCATIHSNYN